MIHGTWEPAPAARWEDAYAVGNGRHGALVLGDPEDDRVTVTHHTLVRPEEPAAGQTPPEEQAPLAAAGERASLLSRQLHPGFRTRVLRPPGGPAVPVRRSVDFSDGVVSGECGERRSEVFVSRADDVLVQYVTAPGPAVEISLDHRFPGAPSWLGSERGIATARRETVLTLRARYPDGPLGYTGLTLLRTDTGRTTLTATGVRVEGAGRLLLLTRVLRHRGDPGTERETEALRALLADPSGARPDPTFRTGPDPTSRTRPVTPGPLDVLHARLRARHTALHGPAYRRVTLDLGADPAERVLSGAELLRRPGSPALLERLFAAERHRLLSSSAGPWTGGWDTPAR
ncbi:glycoside hydrolase N-terminal domain-containing protein [Streptomyces sp. NPDC092359]|uniref:glycoside hydrolase N-terminal domain-containing protein n=1 Tax=Streptomyces sp. NPDC092359 TaxID=3366014 RepID=UPI0038170D7A